jgi:hypothetical protein
MLPWLVAHESSFAGIRSAEGFLAHLSDGAAEARKLFSFLLLLLEVARCPCYLAASQTDEISGKSQRPSRSAVLWRQFVVEKMLADVPYSVQSDCSLDRVSYELAGGQCARADRRRRFLLTVCRLSWPAVFGWQFISIVNRAIGPIFGKLPIIDLHTNCAWR